MLVTPYYNKTTQRGLVAHYNKIASSSDLPCILYHIPSRTGVSMEVDTVKRLWENENIVAIKEASGSLSYASRIAAEIPEMAIYSGNDDIIVPLMSIGAKGVISVVANILPEDTHDLCELCLKGNFEEAKALQLKMLEFINALFCEVNPIPIKEAMNIMGMNVGDVRLPLYKMEEKNIEKLKKAMIGYGMKF